MSLNAYIRKEEKLKKNQWFKSPVKNVGKYEQINPKVSRRKEIIK